MITHIKTVAIYVEDQDRAVTFYTERLGFEVRRKEPMGSKAHWVEMAPPGAQSCLVVYPRSMMADWPQRKPSVVFSCNDAEETYRELSAHGVAFKDPPKRMAWGVFAIFTDPDGNELVLSSPIKSKNGV